MSDFWWSAQSDCGCSPARGILCFKHKLKTIQFASVKPSPQSAMEKRWEKDMPAYQRLRQEGLQPVSIDGSAEMEKRASSQNEIEMGHLFPKSVLPKVEEGMALAKEMDWTPNDSLAACKERREAGG